MQVIHTAAEILARPHVADLELAQALYEAERRVPGSLRRIIAETGLGRRKAYYLVSIWKRFADLGVPFRDLAAVGWTKLAIIARQAQPGQELAALELARGTTARDLPRALRKGKAEEAPRHSVLLRLSPTQYRVFAHALACFGAQTPRRGRGLVGKERALIRALGAIPLERRRIDTVPAE